MKKNTILCSHKIYNITAHWHLKKICGVIFFLAELTDYVLKHISKYSNTMSSYVIKLWWILSKLSNFVVVRSLRDCVRWFFARLSSLSRNRPNSGWTTGIGGGHSSLCVTGADLVLGAFSLVNAGLCTGCKLDIVEGTKVALRWLKKVSKDPFFFIFTFLSCFPFVSRQIFVSRCRFSRLASPTMPQIHSAYGIKDGLDIQIISKYIFL